MSYHALLVQAPNWEHAVPFGPFLSAEDASTYEDDFRTLHNLHPGGPDADLFKFNVVKMQQSPGKAGQAW